MGKERFRGEILGNQKLMIPICCGMPARVARCSRIPKGMRGIRGEGRRKADAEATNTKNTAKTQRIQRIDRGYFAHTGDQTGPTQPHREFRLGETYLPKGARAPRRGLVNLVHEHKQGPCSTWRGNLTRGLYNSKRINSIEVLFLDTIHYI